MTALEQSASGLSRTLIVEPERTGERAKHASRSAGTWVEVARALPELERFLPSWRHLVQLATEPNIFYEPELLIPAIKAFAGRKESMFVFVFRRPHDGAPATPIAFFPLELRSSFRRFPARVLSAWTHPHAFLHTPILDPSFAREAWLALFTWARSESPHASLLEFPILGADGACQRGLAEATHASGALTYAAEFYTRAAIEPQSSGGEAYLASALSPGKYKELRRQRRRLAEQGRLDIRCLERPEDFERWIDYFLELETSGWKGAAHSSLLSDEASVAYFVDACRNLFAEKRLRILGLFLDERPVALKCNFLSRSGSFAIKIAFSEAYAKFSPGVQLELENVLDLHRHVPTRWMDSCAHPDHPMINWLWTERRVIHHLLISPNSKRGNFLLALFNAVRAVKRSFIRKGVPHAKPPDRRNR